MSRREYSHTVFNTVPETAKEEAYEEASRMAAELRHQNLAGDIEIEVERVNPRTFKIYIVHRN